MLWYEFNSCARGPPRGAFVVPRVTTNASTRPIHNNLVGVVILLFKVSISYPVFAAVPFVQYDRVTASQPHRAHFVRPCSQSDEPYLAYLLTLASITRLHLTNANTNNTIPSTNNTATDTSTSDAPSYPLPRVTVIRSPPDAQSPPRTSYNISKLPPSAQ